MTTPEQDIEVGSPDPFRLSGSVPPPGLAETLFRRAEGQPGSAAGMANLLGADTYGKLLGEDPTKAMLKSSEAMLEEVKEQTKYMRDTVEMLRQSNELTKQQAETIKQAVREVSYETQANIARATGATPGAAPPEGAGRGTVGPAAGQGRAPDGVVDPDDIRRMQAEPHGGRPTGPRDDVDEVEERRKAMASRLYAAQSKPIDTLRTEFFSGVARKISEWEPSDDLQYEARLEEMAGVEGPATLALARRRSLAEGTRNVAGDIAEKGVRGGLMKGLAGSGLARMAGTATLAYGALDSGLDLAEGQRKENLAYQAATGDTNFGGFAFRTRQNLYGLTQRGRMGSEQAQELYGAVTRMNVDEQTRAEALDFASDAFMRFGQSVQQSVQMIEQAVARGETNFSQLADSLESVTEAAAAANVNAETARANFTRQLNTASAVFGSGPGAHMVAQIGAEYQTGLGPRFADNQGFNPMTNPLVVNSYAAASGMDYGQVTSSVRQGDRETILGLARQQDAIASKTLGGMSQDAQARIRQSIEARADQRGMTVFQFQQTYPNEYQRALLDALDTERSTYGSQGLDPRALMQTATALTGSAPSTEEEAEIVVMDYLGAGGVQRRAEEGFADEDERIDKLALAPSGIEASNSMDEIRARSGPDYGEDVLNQIRDRTGVESDTDVNLFGWGTTTNAEFQDRLVRTYGSVVQEGGKDAQFSGVLDQLIPALESGQRFVVDTKEGRRVVSAEEAIRNFSDQLQAGTAEVFETGQSVADLLNFEANSAGTTGITGKGGSAKSEDLAEIGTSLDEARMQERERAGLEGRIVVEPGPGLVGPNGQPLFEFVWNMDVAEANRRGVPAPSRQGG